MSAVLVVEFARVAAAHEVFRAGREQTYRKQTSGIDISGGRSLTLIPPREWLQSLQKISTQRRPSAAWLPTVAGLIFCPSLS